VNQRAALRPTMQISLVIGLVLLLVGIGVLDRAVPRRAPRAAPTPPVSAVAAADVESSAWYCAGGTGPAGSPAVATLDLLNTTDHRVTGSLSVVADSGASRTSAVTLAPGAQETVVPSAILSGAGVATSLQFEGGGVLVTQTVDGPNGWSAAPCAAATSPYWYFASGSTEPGHAVSLALFNPTAATAVVDLSFITAHGVLEPQLFEGVVVPAGGLVVEQVGAYVQDLSAISTVVHARTGQVVADETETASTSGANGVSLRLGMPDTQRLWVIPRSVDAVGGDTTFSIFNPSLRPERVVVRVRLASGSVAPFARTLLGQSTWELDASAQVRIPKGVSYSTLVRATGTGVVVDRRVVSGPTTAAPQFGAQNALAVGDISGTQILAAPGTRAHPAVSGAGADALGLADVGTGHVVVTVSRADGQVLRRLVIAPGLYSVIGPGALRGLGRRALIVRADGPVAAMVDLGPTGSPGVVALGAVPIEAG
jgi:hypothetical protein